MELLNSADSGKIPIGARLLRALARHGKYIQLFIRLYKLTNFSVEFRAAIFMENPVPSLVAGLRSDTGPVRLASRKALGFLVELGLFTHCFFSSCS